jgi:hypothetical protein
MAARPRTRSLGSPGGLTRPHRSDPTAVIDPTAPTAAPGPPLEPLGGRRTSANRRIWIVVAVVVAGLVVANLVAQGLDRAVGGSEPGGATGSSYGTGADGLAAFATLLTQTGHDVEQQRGSLVDDPPPSDATAFVLEPNALTENDGAALLQFVTAGGRLVVGGRAPYYLHDFADAPPDWQPAGDTSWTTVDPSLGALHDIRTAGTGSWSAPNGTSPLVGDESESLVTRARAGRGEILYLADASPLENAYLGSGDNAAFALGLAGDVGRADEAQRSGARGSHVSHAVVFAEGVHGYGARRGLGALPDRWKVALVLLGVAALAFVWSRARRFGPPDRTARDLPPARALYVEALSVSLERTRDRAAALAPAQRWARARVAARAGIGATANDDELAGAARSFGCTDDEVAALLAPVTESAGILALGRAVARVSGSEGRLR